MSNKWVYRRGTSGSQMIITQTEGHLQQMWITMARAKLAAEGLKQVNQDLAEAFISVLERIETRMVVARLNGGVTANQSAAIHRRLEAFSDYIDKLEDQADMVLVNRFASLSEEEI